MYDKINIIIPVYNEGQNIKHVLGEIERKVAGPYHVFIIYDFDEDNTIPNVSEYMQDRSNIALVKNEYGMGVLNAIKTGIKAVEDGVAVVVMADLSDEISKVDEMLIEINRGYDIVCGSRYVKGGNQVGGPGFKKILSRMAGVSLHYITGIPTHDISNSFKMYTKKVLNDIEIESRGGFELGMEITIKAFFKGYKITEIPTVWWDRNAGESRFRLWKWMPEYLHWYFFAIKKKIRRMFKMR
jgi:glycosyltransferase involved in cell wall biosynthesis